MTQLNIDALVAEITRAQTLEASAVALINGNADATKKAVADALAAAGVQDQAVIDAAMTAIQAQADSLKASDDALGAAIVANTPAAPVPPETTSDPASTVVSSDPVPSPPAAQ